MSKPDSLQHCRTLARQSAYAEYLCLLKLSPVWRRRLLPLLALDAELRRVSLNVREEMLAHIRYAWWRERLHALPTPGHPVLEALDAAIPTPLLEALVDEAQGAYPARLPQPLRATHTAIHALLAEDKNAQRRWERAWAVAAQPQNKVLLVFRLLFAVGE